MPVTISTRSGDVFLRDSESWWNLMFKDGEHILPDN
jgi:hypothetical protein